MIVGSERDLSGDIKVGVTEALIVNDEFEHSEFFRGLNNNMNKHVMLTLKLI